MRSAGDWPIVLPSQGCLGLAWVGDSPAGSPAFPPPSKASPLLACLCVLSSQKRCTLERPSVPPQSRIQVMISFKTQVKARLPEDPPSPQSPCRGPSAAHMTSDASWEQSVLSRCARPL